MSAVSIPHACISVLRRNDVILTCSPCYKKKTLEVTTNVKREPYFANVANSSQVLFSQAKKGSLMKNYKKEGTIVASFITHYQIKLHILLLLE